MTSQVMTSQIIATVVRTLNLKYLNLPTTPSVQLQQLKGLGFTDSEIAHVSGRRGGKFWIVGEVGSRIFLRDI